MRKNKQPGSRKSISSMYFTTTAVLLIASITVLCFIQMYLVMEYFTAERRTALSDVVELAAAQVRQIPHFYELCQKDPELADGVQQSVSLISRTSSTQVLLLDQEGRLVLFSKGSSCGFKGLSISDKFLAQMRSPEGLFELGDLDGTFNGRYYIAGQAVLDEQGQPAAYVLACASASALVVFLGDMFSSFVLSAGLMMLVSSVLSILFTNRLTGPLRRISEAARKFGGGDFSVRVPVAGDDEVAQLAVTFNTMARNLEDIDSSRSNFMGNIAHELRTPMTSIKGFIDGMLDGTIPPEMQHHYLTLVSQEVGRLARLTQNMLDITKLEAGEYKVNARSYDVWETVTGVAFGSEQRILDAGVEIQGLVPTRTPVFADPDLVFQVLYNLLDNAIKFTPKGGAIRFGVQKNGGFVTISVRNTGVGIPAEELPFVFERFYKQDKSRGLNACGSGLGLHICKVLVGLSGGEIWVDSQEGEWCQFSFTLPCEEPGAKKRGLNR